jgi:hypothetical protein
VLKTVLNPSTVPLGISTNSGKALGCDMINKVLYVFIVASVYEILYITWLYFCTRRYALTASVFSVVLSASSLFNFIHVVRDTTLITPYLAGIFLGSLLAIWSQPKIDRFLDRRTALRDRDSV